jgi:hypothetical protein
MTLEAGPISGDTLNAQEREALKNGIQEKPLSMEPTPDELGAKPGDQNPSDNFGQKI